MKRLLIVDDEPAIGRLVKRVAEGCGYDVTATDDSEHFLDELIAIDPDVIVLDLSLPQLDGVELLRFLAASKCRAKILILSGFDARVLETTGRLGSERGLAIAGTLSKPLRVADLREALVALDESAES
jgi:DNA-binding response OmpR family regulator